MRTLLTGSRTGVFLISTVLALVSPALAQPSDSIVGAWEITGSIRSDGTAMENLKGMILFTPGGHYSWIRLQGTRPSYPSVAEATDAQKIAAFDTFGANAGTYTVTGSTLTRDPSAAKNPYVYAPARRIVQTFQIDGKTLTLTAQNDAVQKFTRIE